MDNWIVLSILSALFLAFYDLSKKHALIENAVLPVLVLSTTCGAIFISPAFLLSQFWPEVIKGSVFFVHTISLETHGFLLIKAIIVSTSWLLAYFALKHLPITIASPIRATAPFFTILGAILLFHENPSILQWLGIILILVSYYLFSIIGKKEGILFLKSPWVALLVGATIIGAGSALYDKYLIQNLSLPPVVVQFWFSVYLVLVQWIILLLFWLPRRKRLTPFSWTWSIPCIGILLIVADFVYFHAISNPDTMISIISPIRRSNAFFALILGGLLFNEINKKQKMFAMIGVFAGIVLLTLK